MRKIVAGFAASLDGYIEGPNGEYDWILIDKEIDFAEQMKRFDAFFYGRKTYEMVARMGKQESSGVKHYVVSTTLSSVEPGFTLIRDDVANEVLKIKASRGKDIAIFGGVGLLTSLFDLQLVDELSVSIIPVLIGRGKSMVGVLENHVSLSLQKSHVYSNGTVQLTYDVVYASRKTSRK